MAEIAGDQFSPRVEFLAWGEGELDAIAGEHRMDFVRDSRDGAINGDIKVELALGSLDLGFSGLVPPSILGTRLMPWRPRPVSRKAEMG